MLIAEIRGKLGNSDDLDDHLSPMKEDLLTSDVFGALKYLPRSYLAAVLQCLVKAGHRGADFDILQSALDAVNSLDSAKLRFWPTYSTGQHVPGGSVEPDVELEHPELSVFFEAKLLSPLGPLQVERELLCGLERAAGRPFFLVLVTAKSRPPRLTLNGERLRIHEYLLRADEVPELTPEASEQLKNTAGRVFWMSWRALFSAVETHHRFRVEASTADDEGIRCADDIIRDLRELLSMRGIRTFRGIGRRLETVKSVRLKLAPVATRRPVPRVRSSGVAMPSVVSKQSLAQLVQSVTFERDGLRLFEGRNS